MKRLTNVNIVEYAKICALTGLIIGFVMGLVSFIGLGVASSTMDWAMDGVFSFLEYKEKSDDGIDNEAFAQMAINIAQGISKMKGMSDADYKKMYPTNEDGIIIKEALANMENKVLTFFSSIIGAFKWILLIGFTINGAVFGYLIGLLGSAIYNKLNGMQVELQ